MRKTATAFAIIGLMAITSQAEARRHRHHVRHHAPAIHHTAPQPFAFIPWTPFGGLNEAVRPMQEAVEQAAHAAAILSQPPETRVARAPRRTAHNRPRIAQGGLGHTGGMNGAFVSKLAAMNAAMPTGSHCVVGSGWRSYAQQARLRAEKGSLAARPGHSNHERGLAADLSCRGRGLAWAHRLAGKFALRFPMSYEPWHIEPVGASRYARRHVGARYAHARGRYHHHHRYARA